MPKRKYSEPAQYPKCSHCGGEHWGQRFDDCPYVNILKDSDSTEEQRRHATEALEAHKTQPPVAPGDRR